MSITLMTAAFKTTLPTTQKFVFVALCDNASDQGECYPSIFTICEKTSLKERAVQGAIKYLVEKGYMTARMRRGQSTVYTIKPVAEWPQDLSTTPAPDAPPQEMHPRTKCGIPPHNMRPTPAPDAGDPRIICAHNHHLTIIEPSINRQYAPAREAPPSPKPKPEKPEKFLPVDYLTAKGVDAEVAGDWLAMRKAKKAQPTKTAIDGIASEAAKAGISLEDALKISCANGWQGFRADWINREYPRGGGIHAERQRVADQLTGRARTADEARTIEADACFSGERGSAFPGV